MSAPTYLRSERALWRRVGADVVAALPESDDIHLLSGGAGPLWRALEEPGTADALVNNLAASFGIASDVLAIEARRCLEDLVVIGLVEQTL